MYPFAGSGEPVSSDSTELVLQNTWHPALEVTGIEGLPALQKAGNCTQAVYHGKNCTAACPNDRRRQSGEGTDNSAYERPTLWIGDQFRTGNPKSGMACTSDIRVA